MKYIILDTLDLNEDDILYADEFIHNYTTDVSKLVEWGTYLQKRYDAL